MKKILTYTFGGVETKLKAYLRFRAFCQRRSYKFITKLITNRLQVKFGLFINQFADIPLSTHFPHPSSIVIGEGVILGNNTTIYQNVTIGGARIGDWQKGNYPIIDDDVVIFAGAVIVGKVKVGKGCVIGANSVVLTDIPSGATAVGAPARVIRAINKDQINA